MAQSKHTPAPWVVRETSTHVTVVGANGDTLFHDDKRIPLVLDDARLIAAAPEQHEALCCAPVLSMYHGANGFELDRFIKDYEAWSATKRAAIAKATGATK